MNSNNRRKTDKTNIDKKITIGHTIYAFKEGGMERGILNLINYGDQRRFRHVIICLTEAGAFADLIRSTDCIIIELQKRTGNDWRLPWAIAHVARRYGIDVFHARGWPTLVETVLAARLSGVRRTIYGFHGRTIEDLSGLTVKRRLAQKVFIRFYQRVMTLNAQMQAEFASESELPERRIRVISNGVDTSLFRPLCKRRALRTSFGLPIDRFIIGNVARLDPVKNHALILRALKRLQAGPNPPLLLLVGEGSQKAVLEKEIATLGLSEDVCLYGYSDRVPELLNCMDVYLQSSFYEGFSNTVLEAMSCGLPIVATDTGGTRDLFDEGQEGYFVQPSDDQALASRILQLQADTRLCRTIGDRARQRAVDNFSVQTMVRNYESLYQELVLS